MKLIIFLEKAGIFLLEFSNFCQWRRKSSDLLWSKAQGCLELCHGLLELGDALDVYKGSRRRRTDLLDVSFSFCAMPRLGLGVTAALRALSRVCRMTAYRRHQV